MMQTHYRQLHSLHTGQLTTDGAGVKLTRILGVPGLEQLDPFLMLDCFASDEPQDYIGGFPNHPHRGFSTVTYLLDGRMRHGDSMGHNGVIEPGGVQWMKAARGVIHSEMPEQDKGLLKGFQLWVNLPASAKMTAPSYQEFTRHQIPVEQRQQVSIRVIAGQTDSGTQGPVQDPYTKALYMDVSLAAGACWCQSLETEHNAFVYVIEGTVHLTDNLNNPVNSAQTIQPNQIGILTQGSQLVMQAGAEASRCLLIAGRPLHEPLARGGPFVMNTQAELMQAFDDYRHGRLVSG